MKKILLIHATRFNLANLLWNSTKSAAAMAPLWFQISRSWQKYYASRSSTRLHRIHLNIQLTSHCLSELFWALDKFHWFLHLELEYPRIVCFPEITEAPAPHWEVLDCVVLEPQFWTLIFSVGASSAEQAAAALLLYHVHWFGGEEHNVGHALYSKHELSAVVWVWRE